MVYFGSGQGRREVETGGVAGLRRGFQPNENAGLGRKMPFVDEHLILHQTFLQPHQQPDNDKRRRRQLHESHVHVPVVVKDLGNH